jgi:hypothetical protein
VARVDKPLAPNAKGARVWFLLDPQTRFSRRGSSPLLNGCAPGGTLIWTTAPEWSSVTGTPDAIPPGIQFLYDELNVTNEGGMAYSKTATELPCPR